MGTTTSKTFYAKWAQSDFSDVITHLNQVIPSSTETNIGIILSYLDYTITWSSSNSSIIDYSGVYYRPYNDTIVTLEAEITNSNNDVITKSYDVIAIGYKDISSNIASSYIYTGYNTVDDVFFDSLDVINAAFTIADANANLTGTYYFNNVSQYLIPRARQNGNWVIMSIAPESHWSTIAMSSVLVEKFANNIVTTINNYGFDGVDIDWEYPKDSTEAALYTQLMKVVRTKVKQNNPNHLVTTAIAGGMWQVTKYDLANSLQYIDYINVMMYDMSGNAGQYQNPLYKRSGYHNTINSVGSTLTSTSIDETVKLFNTTYKVPYSKMIIGIPFYGVRQTRTLTNGVWSNFTKSGTTLYHTLVNSYINNSDYTYYFDEVSKVPYLLKNDGTEFISYENYESAILKANYVKTNNLAGMMFWQYGGDNTGTLLSAIYNGLK